MFMCANGVSKILHAKYVNRNSKTSLSKVLNYFFLDINDSSDTRESEYTRKTERYLY